MPRPRSTKSARTPARQAVPQPAPTAHIIHASKTTLHHGPIPSPDVLREYDMIVSGAAERIVAMAEKQAQHRQELEARSLEADIRSTQEQIEVQRLSVSGPIRNEMAGLILGWSVAASCVGGAIYSAIHGLGPLMVAAFLCIPVGAIINAVRRPLERRSKKN